MYVSFTDGSEAHNDNTLFTARCYAERGTAMVKSSVCLSVCPSVTLRYRDHIDWISSKIISPFRFTALGVRPLQTPKLRIYCKWNTLKFWPE